MKIHRVGAELFDSVGRTDGQTDMTKLIVGFRNFANALNKCNKNSNINKRVERYSGVPRNFFSGGGVSTNLVEDRENGDLGAVAP